MTLVDVPMVSAATVEAVVDAGAADKAPIVRPPSVGARAPRALRSIALRELRQARSKGRQDRCTTPRVRIVNIVPPDDGCLRDIDTPEDYASLLT